MIRTSTHGQTQQRQHVREVHQVSFTPGTDINLVGKIKNFQRLAAILFFAAFNCFQRKNDFSRAGSLSVNFN